MQAVKTFYNKLSSKGGKQFQMMMHELKPLEYVLRSFRKKFVYFSNNINTKCLNSPIKLFLHHSLQIVFANLELLKALLFRFTM